VFGTGTVDAHLQGMGLKVLYQRRRRPKPKTLKGGAMMFHHPVASKFPEKSIVIKENRTPHRLLLILTLIFMAMSLIWMGMPVA
jgi:hypothetical protein